VFGERMRGKGAYWEAIERLFRIHCERLGFNRKKLRESETPGTFQRPTQQQRLFS
jgi:hypothetical protein